MHTSRRVLAGLLVVVACPLAAFPQVLSCATIQGTCANTLEESTVVLNQDASGNLTGTDTDAGCDVPFPLTGTFSSGGYFTYAVTGIYGNCASDVTWVTYKGWVGQPGCNYAYGNWSNSNGGGGAFGGQGAYPPFGGSGSFTKPVDVPTEEGTAVPTAAQWSTTYSAPWNQTFAGELAPSEFEGRTVYEYPGTGPGDDTCWFKGSTVAIFDAVTSPGFPWYVSAQNSWGTDFIGWNLAAVEYYRSMKRVPCSSTFLQQMVVDAAYNPNNPSTYTGPYTNNSGDTFYGVPYEVNTLGASITATTATSVRNGKTSTNTTWK